jgi:integrase
VRRGWEGGYVRRDKKGRDVFVIERWVSGRKFHVSTRCHSHRPAIKQLERFEADPESYRPDGDEVVQITDELLEGFLDHLVKQRETSGKYAREMVRHLADWAVDLKGKNLRKLELADIRDPLSRRTNQQHRVIAIKGFCRWLRQDKGLLRTAEDITLEVSVPQATPEKRKRKKVVELERIRGALAQLKGPPRDFVLVLTATGMHITELERFCRRQGDSDLVEGNPVVLITPHKSGEKTRIPLGIPEVCDAARRLRAAGEAPSRMHKRLKDACIAAEVKPFTMGLMRHTVGTYAVNGGSSVEVVAKFLGHQDPKTTRRFYLDLEKPTEAVPVPALRLVTGG